MLRLLLALIVTLSISFAELLSDPQQEVNQTLSEQENNTSSIEQKVLYLTYEKKPKRVIKGELFGVTVKTLCVLPDIEDIEYELSNQKGVEILNDGVPFRQQDERYFYDTFYFKATATDVRLPDITAHVVDYFGTQHRPTTLAGEKIEAIALHPKEDFCNIIAKELTIKRYKTTTYDDLHNIVVFLAEAKQTFLSDFHLNNVASQGFESLSDTIDSSRMIYYAVIDKKIENLTFSYFNTLKNDYITLNIPIIVEDDRVTTQSDLKPKDSSKQKIKMFIALGIIAFGVVMLLWRQRYIYIALIVIPAVYVIVLMMPQEQICIKESSKIRILPLQNSTIFKITQQRTYLNKIGQTEGFVKVELDDNKIGWVKNEDLCSY